ncbi:hypothetical protein HanIR_Chr15g0748761 [Helianthus annuus]|nr:hypothetical protein HanIR_Chr15g0748761 [Helianthus annuus]
MNQLTCHISSFFSEPTRAVDAPPPLSPSAAAAYGGRHLFCSVTSFSLSKPHHHRFFLLSLSRSSCPAAIRHHHLVVAVVNRKSERGGGVAVGNCYRRRCLDSPEQKGAEGCTGRRPAVGFTEKGEGEQKCSRGFFCV